MTRYILWDFDGTLATRAGMWSGAMHQAIARHAPNNPVSLETIGSHLHSGFPWHAPEHLHDHLSSSAALWWLALERLFHGVLGKLGYDEAVAREIAASVKTEYLDLRHWQLASGIHETMNELSQGGWRHVVVSNHVPELPDLIKELGIAMHFEKVFTSALVGAEKPNPIFFRRTLSGLEDYDEIWIVGDSLRADIHGGKAVGLNTILVGSENPSADACAADIRGVPEILRTRK